MHYSGSVVRPPYEARSVLLEISVGCSHNKCAFCNYYRNDKFRMAPMEQIEEDLKEVRAFDPNLTHLFAVGADPFVMSFDKLNAIALKIKEYLPLTDISMYASISNIKDKTIEQLKELQKNGIHELVIGVESGDDEVLDNVNKGYSAADIVEQCQKLDDAGIRYRFIYITGLAGKDKCVESAENSAKIFNQVHPTHLILTSLTLMPGTELYADNQEGRFEEASELERIEELLTLVEDLTGNITILGGHVSMSIPFDAELPKDKEKTVNYLEAVIKKFDEDGFRRRREGLKTI